MFPIDCFTWRHPIQKSKTKEPTKITHKRYKTYLWLQLFSSTHSVFRLDYQRILYFRVVAVHDKITTTFDKKKKIDIILSGVFSHLRTSSRKSVSVNFCCLFSKENHSPTGSQSKFQVFTLIFRPPIVDQQRGSILGSVTEFVQKFGLTHGPKTWRKD